jgi:hypothetical protein
MVLLAAGIGPDELDGYGIVANPWYTAVRAMVAGDDAGAAAAYAAIGCRPDEARARFRLAGSLHAAGRHDEARAEAAEAARLWSAMGAGAYEAKAAGLAAAGGRG